MPSRLCRCGGAWRRPDRGCAATRALHLGRGFAALRAASRRISRAAPISPPTISIAATMRGASPASLRSAEAAELPLVATNDVLYHLPERRPLQDVLTCIREGCTIAEAGFRLAANAERHLKPPHEMARLFRGHADAVARSLEIAERCRFSLDELRYEYPGRDGRGRADAAAGTARRGPLTWEGAGQNAFPQDGVARLRSGTDQIEHELADLIERLDYAPLFPDRPRHRAVRAAARHPVPGARLGRQFGGVLLPRHHRGRSGAHRRAVRALHQRRAQRAARHRRRFRARAARGGDPVHLSRNTAATGPGSPPP